jgi:hypothetical protein
MLRILEETRKATAILCARMDSGDLDTAELSEIRHAIELISQGEFTSCLWAAAIICELADVDAEWTH